MASYIVALTGASGAAYGVRLISEILERGDDVELIISPSGFLLLEEELGLVFNGKDPAGVIIGYIEKLKKGAPAGRRLKKGVSAKTGTVRYNRCGDLRSPLASGSFLSSIKAMIIAPCSMGTLARIASGISGNLIERAADCVLKERGTLIIVPRETPLNSIHLENMLKLSRAGAVILPAMPAFYPKPKTVEEMVGFVVGKILDLLNIENRLYKRWGK